MKKLLYLLLFITSLAVGQKTDATMESSAIGIRDAAVAGSNTATRIGNMFLDLVRNKSNKIYVYTTTGSANTYAISVDPTITSYVGGQWYLIKFNAGNTSASTITINGGAALSIVDASGSAITSGTLVTGSIYLLANNSGVLQIIGGAGTGGGGSGTVTSVSVTTANGISGSVANSTTTPAITLTLGAITPTSVNSVVISGSSTPTLTVTGTSTIAGTHSGTSSGTNTGDQTTVTGNAGSATVLATPRTIGITTGDVTSSGSSFDGSANNTNALTLANTAVTPGSYTLSSITVDSKGRITAASSGSAGGTGTVTTVTGSSPIVITSTPTTTPNVTIGDAAADGTTKGAATFTAAEFNASSGLVSLDYANGQKATTSIPGFLSATDWTTFNGKQATLVSGTNIKTVNSNSLAGSGNVAVGDALVANRIDQNNASTTSAQLATTISDELGTGLLPLSEYTTTTQSGTTYTPTLSDRGTIIQFTNASSITFTIPLNASVAFPTGTQIIIRGVSCGVMTFSVSGITYTTTAGVLTSPSVSGSSFTIVITKRATDTWHIDNGQPTLVNGNGTTFNVNKVDLGALTSDVNLSGGYKVGIGIAPTSSITIQAGSATANTAPLQLTTGALETVIVGGKVQYNNAFYLNTAALNQLAVGGKIAGFNSDVNNGTTVETDLYTYTTKASTLGATDEELEFTGSITLNDATATSIIKFYFGGTSCGATSALAVAGALNYVMTVKRTGSTTARSSVTIVSGTATTFTAETDLTGLTFTNTNIIKVTGQAGGGTGGSSDITAKFGKIMWWPAANN